MFSRIIKDESGAALVEATLVIPIGLMLVAGLLSFSIIYLNFGGAQKAIREATRYLARVPSQFVCPWGLTNAQNMAVSGTAGLGWSASDITMTPACPNPSTTSVRLQATLTYTPFIVGALGIPFTLSKTVSHEEPYIGTY